MAKLKNFGYTKTNLTEIIFDKATKYWIPKVKELAVALRMIQNKQADLYGTMGSIWVGRFIFEVLNTDKDIDELWQQYGKPGL